MAITATILLLDLQLEGREPIANVHQVDRLRTDPEQPDPRIRCNFRQKTPSKNLQDFGGLGVFIETAPGIVVRTMRKTGLTRSPGRLSFDFDTSDREPGSQLEVVVVFPHGWLPAEMKPLPHEAKVSNGRLVVRWEFRGRQPQPLLSWNQRERAGEDLGQIEEGITNAGEEEHRRKPIAAIAAEAESKPAPRAHVVILVHGINTKGLWRNEIRAVLKEEGLIPAPVGYDVLHVLQFLSPASGARREAIEVVTKNILDIRKEYPDAKISFIAHSFGTFVVTEFLKQHESFKVSHLILCGSVLPRLFDFVALASRLEETEGRKKKIINDCGTHDIWPVLAGRITKRYGASGTFGSDNWRVENRWHGYMRHSGFLNEDFCRKYWIPFLKNGTLISGERSVTQIPRMISVLSSLPLKSLLTAVTALTLVFLCYRTSEPPSSYRIGAGSDRIGFANSVLTEITSRLARSSCSCPTDYIRGKERVTLESVASENLAQVVVPGEFVCDSCYPMQALRKFNATFPTCLSVFGLKTGRLSIDVNPNGVRPWTDDEGRQWKRCKLRAD